MLIYRRHGANMTEHLALAKSDVLRVLGRAEARRRARAGSEIAVVGRLSDRRAARRPVRKEKDQ